jgi:hypothetical protein
LYGAE